MSLRLLPAPPPAFYNMVLPSRAPSLPPLPFPQMLENHLGGRCSLVFITQPQFADSPPQGPFKRTREKPCEEVGGREVRSPTSSHVLRPHSSCFLRSTSLLEQGLRDPLRAWEGSPAGLGWAQVRWPPYIIPGGEVGTPAWLPGTPSSSLGRHLTFWTLKGLHAPSRGAFCLRTLRRRGDPGTSFLIFIF